ncbi:MAG: Zn-dependent hydrolase [Saprospiraceae bacterium]|nr:Zn-dependent hydrolase [Saprospiraceae bacterium]
MIKPSHNPELPFIKDNYKGNLLTEEDRYTNLFGDDLKSLSAVLKWQLGKKPLTKLKENQISPLQQSRIENIHLKNTNAIIPLGHAGFIIDMNEIRIIIDPLIVPNILLKRYTEIPLDPQDLKNVNYLLLSHNHRDHIDKASVIKICRNNPNAVILTGLEIKNVLRKWKITNPIQEAGWYQKYNTLEEIQISYLPTQHWSRRWIKDTNQSLWGSFIIIDKLQNKNIYFGGDSGYGIHYKEFGNMFDIDIAMLGIGAFEPKWFMNTFHTGPEDAIQAFKDLKAKKWIPMHYGTLDLSDEPVFYPEQVLREEFPHELPNINWMTIGERILI